ncbi:hypothetical protein T439DRAFT_368578 [Meredithblackwellia eburnea MCA 4105]
MFVNHIFERARRNNLVPPTQRTYLDCALLKVNRFNSAHPAPGTLYQENLPPEMPLLQNQSAQDFNSLQAPPSSSLPALFPSTLGGMPSSQPDPFFMPFFPEPSQPFFVGNTAPLLPHASYDNFPEGHPGSDHLHCLNTSNNTHWPESIQPSTDYSEPAAPDFALPEFIPQPSHESSGIKKVLRKSPVMLPSPRTWIKHGPSSAQRGLGGDFEPSQWITTHHQTSKSNSNENGGSACHSLAKWTPSTSHAHRSFKIKAHVSPF